MNSGTPAGTQLELGVKAIFPASTSSMSFFMRSFTHGFRFGLERSAIRKLGCALVPLGTKGCAGSLTMGGSWPGTGSKNGPAPFSPTQPAPFEEKSGGDAFVCAMDEAIGAAATAAKSALPTRVFAFHINEDMVVPPFVVVGELSVPPHPLRLCLRGLSHEGRGKLVPAVHRLPVKRLGRQFGQFHA